MSRFEEVSCKVLGVIIFLLVVMTWLQISGCYSPPRPEMEGELIPDYIDEVEMKNLA
jgi:hypothetical protein